MRSRCGCLQVCNMELLMSDPSLTDVVPFIRVTETDSIALAATRLGVAKSIVSRRVSRLEIRTIAFFKPQGHQRARQAGHSETI